MKRIPFLIVNILCAVLLSAQEKKVYALGDTLFLNSDNAIVSAQTAQRYGVVTELNEAENIATILFYSMSDNTLQQEEQRIASGKNFRRCLTEKLFREDGSVQELIVFHYPKGQTRTYDRTCFYPNGAIQCQETMTDKGTKQVYFNEKGKKTKRPQEKIAIYMEMPEFPGGQEELFAFLSRNVRYPRIAQENGIQGRVICQFVVNKNGDISDIEVVRTGGDPSLDNEAIRVIKAMPRWLPGKVRGKLVRVKYTLPVNFKLQ